MPQPEPDSGRLDRDEGAEDDGFRSASRDRSQCQEADHRDRRDRRVEPQDQPGCVGVECSVPDAIENRDADGEDHPAPGRVSDSPSS